MCVYVGSVFFIFDGFEVILRFGVFSEYILVVVGCELVVSWVEVGWCCGWDVLSLVC